MRDKWSHFFFKIFPFQYFFFLIYVGNLLWRNCYGGRVYNKGVIMLVLEEFEMSNDSIKLVQNFPSKHNSNIVLFKINVPPRSYVRHAYFFSYVCHASFESTRREVGPCCMEYYSQLSQQPDNWWVLDCLFLFFKNILKKI